MNKDQARHVAAVLNAWADGETVQFNVHEKWIDLASADVVFAGMTENGERFRIKPEPLEGWAPRVRIYECEEDALKNWRDQDIIHVREVIE